MVGKKMIPVYIDEDIYRDLRRFAFDAEKSLAEVIRPLTDDFRNSVIKLADEVKDLKKEGTV